MYYPNVVCGRFLSRPNRFIAHVEIEGKEEVCHVKNTGRCRELLLPGAKVYLQHFESGARKTAYDLIAVEKGSLLVNMDSQAPNKVFGEWAADGGMGDLRVIRPEFTYGASRFDFRLETESIVRFVEVKGVTLEENGEARFPDAPTERGIKHIRELQRAVEEGYEAAVFFVVQMKGVRHFTPNDATHPAFGAALREAAANGVKIYAYDCVVKANSLTIDAPVPVIL